MSEKTEAPAVDTVAAQLAEETMSKLRAEGGARELERVIAISNLPHEGHEALIVQCMKDGECTVEMAAAYLVEAAQAAAEAKASRAAEVADAKALSGLSAADSAPAKETASEWETDAELRASFNDDESLYKEWLELEKSGRVNNSSNRRAQ